MVRKRRRVGRKRDGYEMLCVGEGDEIYDERSVNEVVESQNVGLEKQEIRYLYIFIYERLRHASV